MKNGDVVMSFSSLNFSSQHLLCRGKTLEKLASVFFSTRETGKIESIHSWFVCQGPFTITMMSMLLSLFYYSISGT